MGSTPFFERLSSAVRRSDSSSLMPVAHRGGCDVLGIGCRSDTAFLDYGDEKAQRGIEPRFGLINLSTFIGCHCEASHATRRGGACADAALRPARVALQRPDWGYPTLALR